MSEYHFKKSLYRADGDGFYFYIYAPSGGYLDMVETREQAEAVADAFNGKSNVLKEELNAQVEANADLQAENEALRQRNAELEAELESNRPSRRKVAEQRNKTERLKKLEHVVEIISREVPQVNHWLYSDFNDIINKAQGYEPDDITTNEPEIPSTPWEYTLDGSTLTYDFGGGIINEFNGITLDDAIDIAKDDSPSGFYIIKDAEGNVLAEGGEKREYPDDNGLVYGA